MIILQENKALNRVMLPFPTLVLTNRIARNLINKILPDCTIKRGTSRDMPIWNLATHLLNLSLGGILHQSKYKEVDILQESF